MGSLLPTAVLGATGYSGYEVARILLRHPQVAKPLLLSRSAEKDGHQPDLAHLYPALSGNGGHPMEPFSWDLLAQHGVKLLFLATPHEASRALAPEAIARGLRVIDLSGAWRLKEEQNRAVYKFEDKDAVTAAELTEKAIYGLPELHADRIPGAAPLVKAGVIDREKGIISDSKSGVSGAGKEPTAKTHFVSVADNLSAYGVFGHRHLGEILEQLNLHAPEFIFTPHLLPIPRGILYTIYVHLNRTMQSQEVEGCFREFYAGKRWVRVFPTPQLPQIQFSLYSNYCDIGFHLAQDGRRLVLISCLDNLLKGAAGQAVQNMNLMYGWKEDEGLQ